MKVIAFENEKEAMQKGVTELQSKIDVLQDQVDKQAMKDTQIVNLSSTVTNLQKVNSIVDWAEQWKLWYS